MLLPRGYKWDRDKHHYVWVLNKGEMAGGPFMGKQMTAQLDFFAEQAAKELVDKRVMRELELNEEMATQLQQAQEAHVRGQEGMCKVSRGSRDNNESLSSPAMAQHSMDSGRTESNNSQQISFSIDRLLNEVRRERAERTNTGRNFQQMFDMLRMEIRELRQRDNKQERERERERAGTGVCRQPRAGHTQVEFQTTSPKLRGSHIQQYGRCRDNQSQ